MSPCIFYFLKFLSGNKSLVNDVKVFFSESERIGNIKFIRDIIVWNNTLYIYTTRPGILIGRAGVNIDSLTRDLKDFTEGKVYDIKFLLSPPTFKDDVLKFSYELENGIK